MIEAWILWLVGIAAGLVWYVHAASLRRHLRQAEQQLKEAEQARGELEERLTRRMRRLDTLLSTMSEAVMLVDRDCRVVVANPAAMEMFGMAGTGDGRGRPRASFHAGSWTARARASFESVTASISRTIRNSTTRRAISTAGR